MRDVRFDRALVLLASAPGLRAAEDPAPPTTAQALELARLWLDGQRAEEGVPGMSAAALKDAIRSADALLVVSPEYNFGIPGVLKNAIELGVAAARASLP